VARYTVMVGNRGTFFKGRPVEIKRKVFSVFNFALIYTFCSICPLMLVNLYIGSHEPVVVSGVVIQKRAGMASGKSTITIRTGGGEVSMRLPIEQWENLTQGETISVGVRRGSLGLLYSME